MTLSYRGSYFEVLNFSKNVPGGDSDWMYISNAVQPGSVYSLTIPRPDCSGRMLNFTSVDGLLVDYVYQCTVTKYYSDRLGQLRVLELQLISVGDYTLSASDISTLGYAYYSWRVDPKVQPFTDTGATFSYLPASKLPAGLSYAGQSAPSGNNALMFTYNLGQSAAQSLPSIADVAEQAIMGNALGWLLTGGLLIYIAWVFFKFALPF